MKLSLALLSVLLLTACEQKASEPAAPATATESKTVAETVQEDTGLENILAAQSEETIARYAHRHPKETLEFFGIKPGMTVVEVLPGGGWYSQILVPYLGSEGKLIAQDYDQDIWALFPWANAEFIASRNQWPAQWEADALKWANGNGAESHAYTISTTPESYKGTVDAVLFIRALHNMARFEKDGQFFSKAMQESFDLLKPGGVVGIVQHRAAEDKSDEWADGSRGYLKESFVIEKMQAVGFELVGKSEINANPKDQPGAEDIVWRLPPSFNTSQDNEALRKEYEAIGESDRMTLLFRKP